jgi:hypothetical protein
VEPSEPILDTVLADEFFRAEEPADIENVRAIVADFRADFGPRLAGLRALIDADVAPPESARREAHQLRGVVANFGFAAAAARFRDLEYNWGAQSKEQRSECVRLAEADVEAAFAMLRARYLYLADT